MTKRFSMMALAIAVVLGAGARTASAEPFIFGFTGLQADAVVLVVNGGAQTFSISDSQIDAGVNNAGWWSFNAANTDDNDNYVVGSADTTWWRNFFTFDLSQLDVDVTSAELQIDRSVFCVNDTSNGECWLDGAGPFSPVDYTLWDVTTPYLTLNANDGTSAAIYTDLGSGITYGVEPVSDDGTPNPVVIQLNAAAITAINRNAGEFFSIGGALPGGDVPEPASMALLLLGGGAAAFRARRRRSN